MTDRARDDESLVSAVEQSTIRPDTAQRHLGKYRNPGFLHQVVLGRFLDRMADILRAQVDKRVLDFGCGEALFWEQMRERGVVMQNLTGVDLRGDALASASQMFPEYTFRQMDIFAPDLDPGFDLVLASQVLEHMPEPARCLRALADLLNDDGALLLTVPWEPFFMLSNLARGRDVLRLGNHPEHINLWGRRGFQRLVAREATVTTLETRFPFVIVSARKRPS